MNIFFNPDKALKTCLDRFIETKENELYNNSNEFRQEVFQKNQKDKEILKNHLKFKRMKKRIIKQKYKMNLKRKKIRKMKLKEMKKIIKKK